MYTVVEFGNAFVGPVFSELRQNVTQSIRPVGNTINTHINVTLHSAFHPISSQLPLNTQSDDNMFVLGDGPVYVWDDDAVVPVPQVDGGLAATGALVLCGHTEHHFVGAFAQV